MREVGIRVRSFRSRLSTAGDRGLTLVELLVTMLLSAILLGIVATPFLTVTTVSRSAVSSSQAAASARAAFADMSASIASASEICLPTQLTSTQTTALGNAVRVKTDVYGTSAWEQWWLDPSTGQLLAQRWVGSTPPSSWRTVASQVSPTSSATPPFTIAPSTWVVSPVEPLSAGIYTESGTTSDAIGDTGTWSYSLYVDPTGIIQTSPTSGTVTTTGSSSFSDQLGVAGNTGTVTFTTTTSSPGLSVSSSGAITTTGALTTGSYTVSGTDVDTANDTGSWTYTLYVGNTGTIVQTTPTSGVTTTSASSGFTQQLGFADNTGVVTYTQSGSTELTISSIPAGQVPVVLTIAIIASNGVKNTAASIPFTSSITTLDTAYATGQGTCIRGLG